MSEVEADEIEASDHECFTVSTRSGTEVDDRPTFLCVEERHELVAQFNPATRYRFTQAKPRLLFVVVTKILSNNVHRLRP